MRLLFACTAGAALLAPAYLLRHEALAHDHWISRQRLTDPLSGEWCCGAQDCEVEQVAEASGGYRVSTGEIIPAARVIWKSPDGTWLRCRYMAGERAGLTRCLIGPPPGS